MARPPDPTTSEYWLTLFDEAGLPAVPTIQDMDRVTGLALRNKVYLAARAGQLRLTHVFGRTVATREEWARWIAANVSDEPSTRGWKLGRPRGSRSNKNAELAA